MINTLYLPELREMLATDSADELREFCVALHPARTAEFMEGLTAPEAWTVLQHADLPTRAEIFRYFEEGRQVEIVETQDRADIAALIAQLPPDDRVDVLKEVDPAVVNDLMPLLPVDERRDILRLRAYPEGTAGSVMTTEAAKLSEKLTVGEALEEIRHQAEELETIYYLYVVDEHDHLRGLVSARQLVSSMAKLDMPLSQLMETEIIHVNATDDQEEVANTVARYDLLAIPVVDREHRMLGIITYDDVMDVVREEATEDAHRIAAVSPLDESYLDTHLFTLSWKRGIWLLILFFGALLTALALNQYDERLEHWPWLVLFIPLVISSGGNTGSQSATLIITALTTGDVALRDSLRVVLRELLMGAILGGALGLCGFLAAFCIVTVGDFAPLDPLRAAVVIFTTLLLVAVCGTLSGSLLPLIFKSLGLDPALMSSPFVAGIIDIAGIVIYLNVAMALLPA